MRYHQLSQVGLSFLAAAVLAALPLRVASSATPQAPTWDNMRVKHAWDAVPDNWKSLGPPPPGTTIDLHVALKPHNENALIDALYEVSSPGHPKYGAHLSREGVAKLVEPHPDTHKIVHSWLTHHDIPPSSISTAHGGGWLAITGVPVSQANEMFNASYQLYQHTGTKDSTVLRTVGYALPTVLHAHVRTVAPTTHFAPMRPPRRTSREPSVGAAAVQEKVESESRDPVKVISGRGNSEVTPDFLRWLYGTLGYDPVATNKNALGIVEYENDYPSELDLATFMNVYRADAIDATFTVEEVNDGNYDPDLPGIEGNLIMQHAQAIAYPTPHILYSAGGRSDWTTPGNRPAPDDAFLAWANYVLAQDTIPQTIAILHGQDEKDVPLEYARTVCELFARLGARGVSVIFATGDEGVGSGDCKVNDGSGKVLFHPYFPASCPWVTSVGGTTGRNPEVGASISGGGFSNYFSRPSYQAEAVPDFLHRLGARHYGSYNTDGRGVPDIAAQALNFHSVTGVKIEVVNSTSCAAPTVAGIIALLNDFLLSYGKPPLGFLNPWLYGAGIHGITDIVSGSNSGCGMTDVFSAILGWDPVTGLGSPDFDHLQDVLFDVVETETETPTSTPWLSTYAPTPTPRP